MMPSDDGLALRFGGALDNIGTAQVESPSMVSEEMAELHAIIQAIGYLDGEVF
jgi:hypothetical protein